VWKSVGWGNRAFLSGVLSTAELHMLGSYRPQEIVGVFFLRGDKFRKKVLEQVAGRLYLSCVELSGSLKPHNPPEQSVVPEEPEEWDDELICDIWAVIPWSLTLSRKSNNGVTTGIDWLAFWPMEVQGSHRRGAIVKLSSALGVEVFH